MSKFHSTVSRRDFMKGIGLAGAGLGATAAASPVFHDLDEVMASSNAEPEYRPWWIKERDFENPTTEVDWQLTRRSDRTKKYVFATSDRETHPKVVETRSHFQKYRWDYVKKMYPEWKGNTVRDAALENGSGSLAFYNFHVGGSSFIGLQKAKTPEEEGFSKWQGTPEENLKMVRAATRTFGCEQVAVVEVTANTRKLINLNRSNGKPINFANVDKAVDSDSEYVIPEKCKYMIIYTNLQPTYMTQRCPARVGLGANRNSYTRMPVQRVQLQEFIRGLGYQGLQVDGMCQSNPWSMLGGIGEHTRESMNIVSPFYGAMYRGVQRMLTDLPLAPTKPIDAGVARFCLDCKKCAENCPYAALPVGDPMWEHENPDEVAEDNVIDGHIYKGWRLYNHRCPRCQACQGVCVFGKISDSGMHNIVRAVSSVAPIFNGFFRQMDDAFGYGTKEPESFWDIKSQPVWGIDTRLWTNL